MDLSKLSDYKLVKLIKQNSDSEAYLELKRRNEKCYYRTLSGFCKKISFLRYDELAEQIDEVMLKSINSYRKDKKTKFSTWCTSNSRFYILNTIKHLNELGHFISEENSTLDLLNNKYQKYHTNENENKNVKEHVFHLLDKLEDKRIVDIFKMRYYSSKEDSKWKNISAKMKLSTQQILNLHSKGRELLYRKMTKEQELK
ncbi:MAG: hypothetical protein Q7R95_06200 [bacterium]|nr:hypothetical protein [bacterium]